MRVFSLATSRVIPGATFPGATARSSRALPSNLLAALVLLAGSLLFASVGVRADDATPRESDVALRQALSALSGELTWKPADALSVNVGRLSSRSWGAPLAPTGASIFGPTPETWMAWTGASALDVNMNVGVLQIGLAASTQCIPSCGTVNLRLPGTAPWNPVTSYRTGAPADPNANTHTVAPHVSGRIDTFQFRLAAPQTSGSVFVGPTGPRPATMWNTGGSGYVAGGRWEAATSVALAVDVQHFTDDRVADGAHAISRDGLTFKARIEQTEFVVHTLDVDGGAPDQRFLLWQVRTGYRIPVGPGTLTPEIVRYTSTRHSDLAAYSGLPGDGTETQVRVNARLGF